MPGHLPITETPRSGSAPVSATVLNIRGVSADEEESDREQSLELVTLPKRERSLPARLRSVSAHSHYRITETAPAGGGMERPSYMAPSLETRAPSLSAVSAGTSKHLGQLQNLPEETLEMLESLPALMKKMARLEKIEKTIGALNTGKGVMERITKMESILKRRSMLTIPRIDLRENKLGILFRWLISLFGIILMLIMRLHSGLYFLYKFKVWGFDCWRYDASRLTTEYKGIRWIHFLFGISTVTTCGAVLYLVNRYDIDEFGSIWQVVYAAWAVSVMFIEMLWSKPEELAESFLFFAGLKLGKDDCSIRRVEWVYLLAALLPAGLIGNVYYFLWNEKYTLYCMEGIEHTAELCLGDDNDMCCQVMSTREEFYFFFGNFCSNLIGLYSIITLTTYLLVTMFEGLPVLRRLQ